MIVNAKSFLHKHPTFRRFADLVLAPPTWDEAVKHYPQLVGSELAETWNQYTRQPPLTRLALYCISRRSGSSHNIALACACQAFPRSMTDDVFWGGRKHFAEVYGDAYHKEIKSLLAAKGVTLGAHDEYMPELARFKGDPLAVVNRSQGRSYIAKRCRELGLGCEGAVNVPTPEPDSDPLGPDKCVDMADDLVAENFQKIHLDEAKKLKKKGKRAVKEAVLDKFGARK